MIALKALSILRGRYSDYWNGNLGGIFVHMGFYCGRYTCDGHDPVSILAKPVR